MPRFLDYFLFYAKKDTPMIFILPSILIIILKFNIFDLILSINFISQPSNITLISLFLLFIFFGYLNLASNAYRVKRSFETKIKLTFLNKNIDYNSIIIQSIKKSKPEEYIENEFRDYRIFEIWYYELDTKLDLKIIEGEKVIILGPQIIVQFIELEIHKKKIDYHVEYF